MNLSFLKLFLVAAACALVTFYNAKAQSPVKWQAGWISATEQAGTTARPAQYFQKSFTVDQKLSSARLFITCHGLYEAYINGVRVSNALFTPGWTDYTKRLQYQQYDVSAMLHPGVNTIAVTLGDGWYRGTFGLGLKKNNYGNDLSLLSQLELTLRNGKTVMINSDASWQSAEGPIRSSEIYAGELIDNRVQPAAWKPVLTANYGYSNLIPNEGSSVIRHETFKPLKIFTTPKGERVIDFGQNLVGWVSLKASGPAGTTVNIRHAEVLDNDGNFYTDNLRRAKQAATYVLNGAGAETLEPHFAYYGFRYIAVDGYPGELKPENFTAVALYADMTPAGSFECSNPLLNQLQHNIQWGQRGNFLEVPTDCPQRDERLGWTGDAQVFFRTAAYNFNVEKFFTKWLKDVAADQRPDGAVPWVIPNIIGDHEPAAGWADAATIIPWEMYLVYGDRKILETQYPSMKAWVEYIHHNSVNNLWNKGPHFGDWLSYRSPNDDGSDAITDKYEIAQCFYAYSTQLLINAARVLNNTADVDNYTRLLADVKAAYNQEYVTATGRLMSNTQTAYVLALQFDMLPENKRAGAAKFLADNVKAYNNHLSTGFLGTPYLCDVLTRYGYTDLAYTLLLQPTFPGWLYPIKMGATTVWERWDGIKPDGSFQAARMNSFNHYAYGAIGDWMYRTIAGIDIDPAQPGYRHIIIKPRLGGDLTYCKASLKTSYGLIKVEWHIDGSAFSMDVTVPQNTTATISVPDAAGKNYTAKNITKGGLYRFSNIGME